MPLPTDIVNKALKPRSKIKRPISTSEDGITHNRVFDSPARDMIAHSIKTYKKTSTTLPSKKVSNITFLTGIQLSIVFYLYQKVISRTERITSPLSLNHIVDNCDGSKGTIKKSIQRLLDKSIIDRAESKTGKGGWTCYRLSSAIFEDLNTSTDKNK